MKRLISILYFGLMVPAIPIFAQGGVVEWQSTVQIVLLIILIAVVIYLVIRLRVRVQEDQSEQYRKLEAEHKRLTDEKIRATAEKKEIEKQRERLTVQLEEKQRTINELEKKIAVVDNNEIIRSKEMAKQFGELENSRKSLENEQKRVVEEEREARAEYEVKRNSIWAKHEGSAKAKMYEICTKPDILLPAFDNNNLPDDFDGSMKPDFMVRLLGQYVIFDPKSSSAKNLQAYIQTQVKSTARKIKDSSSSNNIYPMVFFIIPSIGIEDIKECYFVEQGISFFVIPIESFEPIIRTLKRLEEYDMANKYDPKDREDMVNLIAVLNQYVRQQNATNILSVLQGLQALAEISSMPEDFAQDVDNRRKKMRMEVMSRTQLKNLMDNPREQVNQVLKLIEPKKPDVDATEIETIIDYDSNL